MPKTRATTTAVRTLCSLGRGDEALVAGLVPGACLTRQRLVELGFVKGERVRVIAAAPVGQDPIAVRIGTSTFALRRHEASLVQLLPDSAC